MRLTIFDLDHTLLSVNSSYQFGQYLYRQGSNSISSIGYCILCYALHKIGYLSIPQLHQKTFESIFEGKSIGELQQAVESFLDLHLSNLLYEPALKSLQEAQRQEGAVVIMSGSPDFVVEAIAKRLQVTLWEATRYAINVDNRLCGITHVMQGKDKAEAALKIASKMGVQKESIVVYTDSYLDLPLIDIAGDVIGVNPDKKLRKLCQNKVWPIL